MVAVKPRAFLVPPNIIRILELLCSLFAMLLILTWTSRSVSYHHLDRDDVDIITSLRFFLSISIISVIVMSAVCGVILMDAKAALPPIVDAVISAAFCLFWLLCSIILSVNLASISESVTVREMDLHFTAIEVAVSFGFLSMMFHGGSVWFAALRRRRKDDVPILHTRMSAHLQLHSDILM